MALVALLLIGAFVTIYGRLDPVLSDFVVADVPTVPAPTLPAATEVEQQQDAVVPPPATQAPGATQAPVATATASSSSTGVTPTATSDAFQPDYVIADGGVAINFRSGPSLNDPEITSLQPGTPLEFTGEEQDDANNFADNGTWLQFRLDDGSQGWVREIDVDQTGG